MYTYFLFGRYHSGGAKNACSDRTNTCKEITTNYGGNFLNRWALMGEWDIVCHVDFPDNETAMKCAVAWNKCTGMDWTTCPAVDVNTYDNFTAEVWNEDSVPTYYNVN